MTPEDLEKLAQLVADKILDEFDARGQHETLYILTKSFDLA